MTPAVIMKVCGFILATVFGLLTAILVGCLMILGMIAIIGMYVGLT